MNVVVEVQLTISQPKKIFDRQEPQNITPAMRVSTGIRSRSHSNASFSQRIE
jgi:hypothetical protein